MFGLACGDAVGTSVEFIPRETFMPLTDMVGGGYFHLKPGQWTDDTSMALCLAESLTRDLYEGEKRFDPIDQMQRYLDWCDNGYMSSTGSCFDIGNTISAALTKFRQTGKPYCGSDDPRTAGNGSLMRLAPIALCYHQSTKDIAMYSELSSKTTHGAPEAVDACHLFSLMLNNALMGQTKNQIIYETKPLKKLTSKIAEIRKGDYTKKSIDEIKGSGYVVKSLEAALWSFYSTSSFEEAILKAANLGADADTTAAICGQISGAYYGFNNIPSNWKNKISKAQFIIDKSHQLFVIQK